MWYVVAALIIVGPALVLGLFFFDLFVAFGEDPNERLTERGEKILLLSVVPLIICATLWAILWSILLFTPGILFGLGMELGLAPELRLFSLFATASLGSTASLIIGAIALVARAFLYPAALVTNQK